MHRRQHRSNAKISSYLIMKSRCLKPFSFDREQLLPVKWTLGTFIPLPYRSHKYPGTNIMLNVVILVFLFSIFNAPFSSAATSEEIKDSENQQSIIKLKSKKFDSLINNKKSEKKRTIRIKPLLKEEQDSEPVTNDVNEKKSTSITIRQAEQIKPVQEESPEKVENLSRKELLEQHRIILNKADVLKKDDVIKYVGSQLEEINILAAIEKIDMKLASQRARIISLQNKYKSQEKLLQQRQELIDKKNSEKEKVKQHVKKRLSAYYHMGGTGVMNVIFSTESFADLLVFEEYFHHLLLYDQNIIRSYLDKIDKLSKAQDSLILERKKLPELLDQLQEEKEFLATTFDEKLALLTKVKTEKKLYQQAVSEIEKAAADLAVSIEKFKEDTRKQTLASYPDSTANQSTSSGKTKKGKTIAAFKGKLDPPLSGLVIKNYGKHTNKKFGINTFENGIDIKAEQGTLIKAVFDGRIVNAGYLRGYGNMIIIDHGQRYYSVISRVGTLLREEGESVIAGDTIGIMGENKTLLGEGLHFEFRHGSEPQNPLAWLNKKKLIVRAKTK